MSYAAAEGHAEPGQEARREGEGPGDMQSTSRYDALCLQSRYDTRLSMLDV